MLNGPVLTSDGLNKGPDYLLRADGEEALLVRPTSGEGGCARNTGEDGPANALVPLLQLSRLEPAQELLGRHSMEGRLILRARESREAKCAALANRETGMNSKASRIRSLLRLSSGRTPELVGRRLKRGEDSLPRRTRTARGVDSTLAAEDDHRTRRLGVVANAEENRNASMRGARGGRAKAGRHAGNKKAIWLKQAAQGAKEVTALVRGDGVEHMHCEDAVKAILRSSRQSTDACAKVRIRSKGAQEMDVPMRRARGRDREASATKGPRDVGSNKALNRVDCDTEAVVDLALSHGD